jgi:hypothetical protein
MGKKIFVLLILLSLLLAALHIPISNANPPTELQVVNVNVTILSPKNNEVILISDLQLNFTVDVPIEEINSLGYSSEKYSITEFTGKASVVIDNVSYFKESYPISYIYPNTKVTHSLNVPNLPQGQHSLWVQIIYSFSATSLRFSLVGGTPAKTNITILSAPSPTLSSITPMPRTTENNPTQLIVIVIVAVIVAVASVSLIYFKRNKTGQNNIVKGLLT